MESGIRNPESGNGITETETETETESVNGSKQSTGKKISNDKKRNKQIK